MEVWVSFKQTHSWKNGSILFYSSINCYIEFAEGCNSVGKNNVWIFVTKSICMKKSENYLSRKLKEHLILHAFNCWTELEYLEKQTETSIYLKLNSCNLSLLKQKFFKNGYSYTFSQRNQGKWHAQPSPQCIFCYERKAKKRPWKAFTATSLDI